MKLKLLVVEDEWLIATGIEADLTALGYSVIGPAPRLADALSLLASERPDGAILDVNLEGTQVFPLAETLERCGIPFLFLTAYDDRRFLPLRFRDRPVLNKPYSRQRLGRLLGDLFPAAGDGGPGR